MRMRMAQVAIGVALVAAAAALLAPAALVDAALAERTQGAWRITATSGLWWRGEGTLVVTGSDARLPLAWRVALPALARGTLAVTLTTPDGKALAVVDATRERVHVASADARIPAALVASAAAQLAPLAGALAAGGVVSLESPGFEWAGGHGTGSVDARWQRARIAFAGIGLDFGDIELALRPQAAGQDLRGTFANRGGDLALSGDVVVGSGAVSANVALAPRVTTPPIVRSALALFGRPDASGIVHVVWSGHR